MRQSMNPSPAEAAFARLQRQFPGGTVRRLALASAFGERLAGLLPPVDGLFRTAERLWVHGALSDEEYRQLRLDFEDACGSMHKFLDRLAELIPQLRRRQETEAQREAAQAEQAATARQAEEAGLSQGEIRRLRARRANAERRAAQEFLRGFHGRQFYLTSHLGLQFCDDVIVPVDRAFRLVALLVRSDALPHPAYEKIKALFDDEFDRLQRSAQIASSKIAVAEGRLAQRK